MALVFQRGGMWSFTPRPCMAFCDFPASYKAPEDLMKPQTHKRFSEDLMEPPTPKRFCGSPTTPPTPPPMLLAPPTSPTPPFSPMLQKQDKCKRSREACDYNVSVSGAVFGAGAGDMRDYKKSKKSRVTGLTDDDLLEKHECSVIGLTDDDLLKELLDDMTQIDILGDLPDYVKKMDKTCTYIV